MANQITPNPSVPSQVVAEVKFPKFINNLGIIPTSYKDSMSYYECLAWLCKFLEEQVIPTVNENGEAVEELQALYVELNSYVTHYFETLDVQEEINNKLDDMVEAGTLQEIIADYLNSKAVFGFDTVSEMKNATNLINGSYARTLGFYEKNDGGSALYKIRTITNDDVVNELNILEMNDEENQLVAELILNDEKINVKMLGAKGNNLNDDLSKLQSINDLYENKTIFIPDGTYLISNTLYISNNNSLELSSDAEIKATSTMDYLIVYNKQDIVPTYNKTFKKFIKGGTLNGNYNTSVAVLTLQGVLGFNIENVKILNFNLYGLQTKIPGTNVNEVHVNDCYIRNDTAVIGSMGIKNNANDCWFTNIIIRDTQFGIETESSNFNYVHGWIGDSELLPSSYFIKTLNNNVNVSNAYADTYQYSFISTFGCLNITNAFIFNNKNVYTDELQTTNVPVLFKSEQDPFNLGTWGYFSVLNSQIPCSTSQYTANTAQLTNRYNVSNNFRYNYFSNIKNLANINYINDSNTGSGYSGDVNNLIVPGSYGINNATNLPGTFFYGILHVSSITPYTGAYVENGTLSNINFASQIFITSEGWPKMYYRLYSSGSWSSWQKVTSTNMS